MFLCTVKHFLLARSLFSRKFARAKIKSRELILADDLAKILDLKDGVQNSVLVKTCCPLFPNISPHQTVKVQS